MPYRSGPLGGARGASPRSIVFAPSAHFARARNLISSLAAARRVTWASSRQYAHRRQAGSSAASASPQLPQVTACSSCLATRVAAAVVVGGLRFLRGIVGSVLVEPGAVSCLEWTMTGNDQRGGLLCCCHRHLYSSSQEAQIDRVVAVVARVDPAGDSCVLVERELAQRVLLC